MSYYIFQIPGYQTYHAIKLYGNHQNDIVTDKDIKKAFRKHALKHHPDRGGDENVFKKYQKAYEILSDPKKKDVYNIQKLRNKKNGKT